MAIEADIYKRLKNHSGLAALVSTRIYLLVAPQNATRPYIVFQRISTMRFQVFGGTVAGARPRYQFSIYADTAPELVTVSAQLRAAILAMTGDTVTLYETSFESERDDYEPETGLYRRDLDAMILHSE